MKKIIFCSLLIISALSSCNNDDDIIVPSKTEFDIATIESNEYTVGDVVKADIIMNPGTEEVTEININYFVDMEGGLLYKKETIPVDNSNKPFTLKFSFEITPDLKGKSFVTVSIRNTHASGISGDQLTRFKIYLKN